ncbi:MAG: HAMP domain-containing protein [Actinobacteria bacterium]|nr:HAMP domain-containing protein [Actinomycetota bacterium]
MSPLRSVGARLSAALMLVVLVALGVVYAFVVPLLERNLVQSKVDVLATSAERVRGSFEPTFLLPGLLFQLDEYVDRAAFTTNARVVVLEPLSDEVFRVRSDSSPSGADIQRDRVALAAAFGTVTQRGTVTRTGERYAEVAFPIGTFPGTVLLFSAPLEDTLANVSLVRRRVLVAGAVALAVALLLGYGGASIFARRIRRLERAADRIAGGSLDEAVVDHGGDEVGDLARAFERMRRRLAQVEYARREFVANASHELRTPLFSLGGFLELLTHESLDEETRREFLATMQEQVERLQRLATDLLDLSRLDAGHMRTERVPLDLVHVAEALRDEFAAVALSGGRTLRMVVDGAPPQALADEQRVLQIGRALVENALRHTSAPAAVELRVSVDAGGPELAVVDGGEGIPEDHLGHIFERFYRVEGGHASGSGLGLAIARELAEIMGGRLSVDSRPGRTVFSLRLPPARAGEAHREQRLEPETAPAL